VEMILRKAKEAGLGRDGLFIGIGGGVVTDLAGFAASVYMRGCGLCLVSTSLLGMVDAALGGKTGFDLFGVKNFAGTFYPASLVYLPVEALSTLPPSEWKSGMAELIKTAILADHELFQILMSQEIASADHETLVDCVARAASVKGAVVEADPREKGAGTGRALLNLGHTFGHALEASAGLGSLSHGEAVAWGMARACDLGEKLGLTPGGRAGEIRAILAAHQFETGAPHPLMGNAELFMRALSDDKKKQNGKPSFIVPGEKSARSVSAGEIERIGGEPWETIIRNIICGGKT
jgi:3-dehydroquinate synthase